GFNADGALGDFTFELALGRSVLRSVGFVGEHEAALSQVLVEATGELVGRSEMQSVLPENPTECLAERPLTGTTLANECGCDLGLLAGMLARPGLPLDSVIEERLVAGAQHDADMFAHQAPVARLRFDAPAAPKVEASINDLGPAWFERQPTVLSPKMV